MPVVGDVLYVRPSIWHYLTLKEGAASYCRVPKDQNLRLARLFCHRHNELKAGIIQEGLDDIFPESCWQQHTACKQRRSLKESFC